MKNNKLCKEIDKELKEMFTELKGAYKYMARQANSLCDIFTSTDISINELCVNNDAILVNIRDIQMAKKEFDIKFEKIKLLFKLNFNTDYDSITEESVVKYCKAQINFVEYYIIKNGKQIWKKYYIK